MSVLNSLINIDLAEKQDIFLFCNFEPGKKLHIILLDINACKAFNGYATDIDLRSQAASINMIFSNFLSLSTKALTKKETEDVKFLYSLERNCENFVFKWKSVDLEETVITIGNIKVSEKDYSSAIKDVFVMLSKELSSLNSKVSSMENDLLNTRKERDDAVKFSTEITAVKERVEKELFSKFMLVLNEKKEKIRKLKRLHDNKSVSSVVNKKARTTRSKKLYEISDLSDEAFSDMEKELAGPSTSKQNISLPYLDDDDEKPILPSPSKRRIRQKTSVPKVATQEYKNKDNPRIIVESENEDELLLNL